MSIKKKKHGNISFRNCAFWTQKAAPTLTASSPASINALKQCIKHKYTIYLLKYLQCLETSVLCQGNSNTQHNIGNKIWKQIPRFIPPLQLLHLWSLDERLEKSRLFSSILNNTNTYQVTANCSYQKNSVTPTAEDTNLFLWEKSVLTRQHQM